MKSPNAAPSPIERAFGHTFRDRDLLKTALTPPSAGLHPHNQRLEFLGDAVLQLCASTLIFRAHPDWDEGAMSKLRGMLVCTDALHQWALDLGLELERGPRSPKTASERGQRKAKADAVEALLAAAFLDGGQELAGVQEIVSRRHLKAIKEARLGIWEERDAKTTLQEWAALHGLPAPAYELLERSGPDHMPVFRVQVKVGERAAEATAGTLKRAQSGAAHALLAEFKP